MIDQPTAQDALKKLEPLLGEWALDASSPDGEPWPVKDGPASNSTIPGRTSSSRRRPRTSVDVPGAQHHLEHRL